MGPGGDGDLLGLGHLLAVLGPAGPDLVAVVPRRQRRGVELPHRTRGRRQLVVEPQPGARRHVHGGVGAGGGLGRGRGIEGLIAAGVTFYAENERNRAETAWLRLPAALADQLLLARAYEPRDQVFFREPCPQDLLARITSVRRQFTLGRGREFTSTDVDQRQLLGELAELEKV